MLEGIGEMHIGEIRRNSNLRKIKVILVIMSFFLVCWFQVAASEGSHKVKSAVKQPVVAQVSEPSISSVENLNSLSFDPLHIGEKVEPQTKKTVVAVKPAPVKTAAVPSGPRTEYVVKDGDTLWDIACDYNTTVDSLLALNNLKGESLSIGEKLIVNGTKTTVAVAKATSKPSATVAMKENKLAANYAPKVEVSRSGSRIKSGSVLQTAAQYLGTPYRYGGSGPSGFDCSGFTKYVYGQYGYDLPRTAAGQGSVGENVSKSDLKPGDLVLFACGGGGISHVGIYTGNGQFIHSSSPRSGGVIYSSLSESYYANSYVGARRIQP